METLIDLGLIVALAYVGLLSFGVVPLPKLPSGKSRGGGETSRPVSIARNPTANTPSPRLPASR